MSRLQGTQFFQKDIALPSNVYSDLAEYDIAIVPLVVGALQTRKTRSFYTSQVDYESAYLKISRLQKALLMGAVRDLIIEVRQTRGFTGETLADLDPDLVPIGMYPGTQLLDISLKLGPDGFTDIQAALNAANTKLQTLIDNAQSPEDTESILNLLGIIAGAVV